MPNIVVLIHTLATLSILSFAGGLCHQGDWSGLSDENVKNLSILRISVHEREPKIFSNGKMSCINDWELLAERDRAKVNYLFGRNNNISTTKRRLGGDYIYPIEGALNSGIYYTTINLGTPPQPLQLILDTGSSLVWAQSNPCIDCFKSYVPNFFSDKSSTYNPLSCEDPYCIKEGLTPQRRCQKDSTAIKSGKCEYYLGYGLGVESTSGVVAYETLTITNPDVHEEVLLYRNFVFGAGDFQTGQFDDQTTGILGLGRSEFSFISQLKVGGAFALCLPQTTTTNNGKAGYLVLGQIALQGTASMPSISIYFNPSYPDFYYLAIVKIYVDNVLLPIPASAFQFAAGNSGGTIIDTGSTYTTLVAAAFNPLIDELKRQIPYPITTTSSYFELCFDVTGVKAPIVPTIAMEFDNGVTWAFGTSHAFGLMYELNNPTKHLMCLTMIKASHTNVLGVVQLRGYYIAHDMLHNKLYFESRDCTA